MMNDLAERLNWLGFQPGIDFLAQDNSDGKGPFVAAWMSIREQPTDASIAAALPPPVTVDQVAAEAQQRINVASHDAMVNLAVFGTPIPDAVKTLCTAIKAAGDAVAAMSPIPQDYATASRWPQQ